MLCEKGSAPRLAMRGTSMLPLLHEPMVLQLERFTGHPKLGDVLVFEKANMLVAHRFLTWSRTHELLLSGDAQPASLDVLSADKVVGTVASIWSGNEADAKRIDGALHRARGMTVAVRHLLALRTQQAARVIEDSVIQFNPRRRKRTYIALFNAMAAILQRDPAALRAALAGMDLDAFLLFAKRHRCSALIIDGLETLSVTDVLPERALNLLREERWTVAARTRALKQQLDGLIATCNDLGFVPILLKGASRLYTGERDSDRHDSDDIDILLPREQIDRLTDVLVANGYFQLPVDIRDYALLHHTAPLLLKGGFAVELHHVLAPSGETQIATDYAACLAWSRPGDSPSQRVLLLNGFAGALHSTIHARDQTTLRNIVILALQLRALSPSDMAELYAVVDREGMWRHRMIATLYAAARLAGMPARSTPAARRLFGWRQRRFDLPRPLFIRSDAIDSILASSGRGLDRILPAFLPSESEEEKSIAQPLRGLRYTLKFPVKIASIVAAALFASLLPEA